MTRKHYQFMARLIAFHIPFGPARDAAIDDFVAFASKDNPAFDALRFAVAAGHSRHTH